MIAMTEENKNKNGTQPEVDSLENFIAEDTAKVISEVSSLSAAQLAQNVREKLANAPAVSIEEKAKAEAAYKEPTNGDKLADTINRIAEEHSVFVEKFEEVKALNEYNREDATLDEFISVPDTITSDEGRDTYLRNKKTEDDLDSLYKFVNDEEDDYIETESEVVEIEDFDDDIDKEEDDQEELKLQIRAGMDTHFKAIDEANKIDLSIIEVQNKSTHISKIIQSRMATTLTVKNIIWATKRIIEMKKPGAREIEQLDPRRITLSDNNPLDSVYTATLNRFRIIYDNIVSDKPASFKEWLKSTYPEEVDDYYFTLFDATFRDCNIITNQCKCGNFEVTNSPTHTLRKFDTPETETLYQDIINGRKTGESKTKKSELYQVSEDFVVRLGAPSIFTMNIEPLFLDANNRKKYEDIVRIGVCILEMYVIVKGADGKPRLSPVDMGADKSGNEASKYLAKLKALDKMENLITSDQLQCLLVETVKYDTEDTNEVSYAYPEYVCSKCGTKMEALPDRAVNMLFNRHQLGLMKSI